MDAQAFLNHVHQIVFKKNKARIRTQLFQFVDQVALEIGYWRARLQLLKSHLTGVVEYCQYSQFIYGTGEFLRSNRVLLGCPSL